MAVVRSKFSHGYTDRMHRVRQYPLRKVVGRTERHEAGYVFEYELLECGHRGKLIALLNTDMFSPRSADRRRCRECAEQQEGSNPDARH